MTRRRLEGAVADATWRAWRVASRRDPRRVPLYWFRRRPNFGDALSPALVGELTGRRPLAVPRRYEGKVLALGSILHELRRGDLVWGSGALGPTPIEPPPTARFFAVRGPLTRDLIRADVPAVYGDPAMLLPLIRPPLGARPSGPIGIVPHLEDRAVMRVPSAATVHIDVTQRWMDVVDAIRGCSIVISSSLHGIIVAEAYGIPAVWVRASDRVLGGSFKFDDYYHSTGREPRPPVAWSAGLDAALAAPCDTPVWEPEPLLSALTDLVAALGSPTGYG